MLKSINNNCICEFLEKKYCANIFLNINNIPNSMKILNFSADKLQLKLCGTNLLLNKKLQNVTLNL